jgi:hypothetical protein
MNILASHLLSGLASPALYLDPGSGSILVQLILAVILGSGIFLRTQWSKVKFLFKGNKTTEEDPDDEE